MPRMRVKFLKCLQHSQGLGSTDEHMVSRLFFNLEVDGHAFTGFHCDVKQVVGAPYESESPPEVGPPAGSSYHGPFNDEAFRVEAERYYREAFGSRGQGISREPGNSTVMVHDKLYLRQKVVEFVGSGPDAAW